MKQLLNGKAVLYTSLVSFCINDAGLNSKDTWLSQTADIWAARGGLNFRYGGLEITFLLLADYGVQLASSDSGLQCLGINHNVLTLGSIKIRICLSRAVVLLLYVNVVPDY